MEEPMEISLPKSSKKNLIPEHLFKNYPLEWFTNYFINLQQLGRGGFGEVYKAEGNIDGIPYAIKFVKLENNADYEAKFLSTLKHKNIVEYVMCWPLKPKLDQTLPRILCIQMEYCVKNLRELMQQHPPKDNEKWRIFAQILNGMYFIHSQNITHRDIKPENIMLSQKHEVKIGDFGLARLTVKNDDIDGHSKTRGVGTKWYMAPEVQNGTNYNEMCDIYSLGIILFELYYPAFSTEEEQKNIFTNFLSKENLQQKYLLFPGNFAFTVKDRKGIELRTIIKSMLEIDPSKRPPVKKIKEIWDMITTQIEKCIHYEDMPYGFDRFFKYHGIERSGLDRFSNLQESIYRRYFIRKPYNSITHDLQKYECSEYGIEFMVSKEYSIDIAAEILMFINDLRRNFSPLSKFEYKIRINHVKIIEAICVYFGCNTDTIQKIKGHLASTYNQTSENSLTPAQQLSHACHIDLLIAENILYFLQPSVSLEPLKSKLLPLLQENEDSKFLLSTAIKEIELLLDSFRLINDKPLTIITLDYSFIYEPYYYLDGIHYILLVENPHSGAYEKILVGGKYNTEFLPKSSEKKFEYFCAYESTIFKHEIDKFLQVKHRAVIFPDNYLQEAKKLKCIFSSKNYSAIIYYNTKILRHKQKKQYCQEHRFQFYLTFLEPEKVSISSNGYETKFGGREMRNEIKKYFNQPMKIEEAVNFLVTNTYDDIYEDGPLETAAKYMRSAEYSDY